MIVISDGKVFNFSNVARVFYRESVFGDGCPIEIKRIRGGFFNDAVEIARVQTPEVAAALIQEIAEKWGEGAAVFNIDAWIKNRLR